MTRVFNDAGDHIPVTVLQSRIARSSPSAPRRRDGYTALQLGVGTAKVKNVPKPMRGHFAKAKVEPKARSWNSACPTDALVDVGAEITADHFVAGQYVDVTGTSIGKGFAGGMKRWNFGGLRATHGVSVSHRSLGSTGKRQDPGRPSRTRRWPAIWAPSG